MIHPEQLLRLCATFAKLGDWAGVHSAARACTIVAPQRYDAWVVLGSASANLNDHQDALHAYERALRLRPDALPVWVDVAESHIATLNYPAAAAALRQAMQLDPRAEHPAGRRARALTARVVMSMGAG